jgi:hypothetical protein
MVRAPTITVPAGTRFTVIVPPDRETATDVTVDAGDALPVKVTQLAALKEQCSVLLANGGRRTIMMALTPGQAGLSATITPPTAVFMPAWAGEVIVTKRS